MKTVNGITLYTVDEVAEQLNISRLTVLKYIKQGRLYAQRIGRPYMITEDGLRKFLLDEAAGMAAAVIKQNSPVLP